MYISKLVRADKWGGMMKTIWPGKVVLHPVWGYMSSFVTFTTSSIKFIFGHISKLRDGEFSEARVSDCLGTGIFTHGVISTV
jgi:hypothetical protein